MQSKTAPGHPDRSLRRVGRALIVDGAAGRYGPLSRQQALTIRLPASAIRRANSLALQHN
jgi:hypothetical protein